jgi:hypothetical protein
MTTLADMQARLARYLAAETKILEAQEYAIGSGGQARRNRRAELEQVQSEIRKLQIDIAAEQAKTVPVRRVMFIR